MQRGAVVDVVLQLPLQSVAVDVRDDAGAGLAGRLVYGREHDSGVGLRFAARAVHVLVLAADERLVRSDCACIFGTAGSLLIASQMRWSKNHAVRAHTPYLRSTSRADTPFLLARISKMTTTQERTAIFVPCMTMPVRTEN
jgi:hypothetical protein